MALDESFVMNAAVPNFTRDEFETVEQMKNFLETRLPDTYVSRVKETGEFFIFNKNNIIDETYGKWKKINGQYKVLPTPTESFEGNVVQYIGETNEGFSQGVFYTIKKEDSGEKSSLTLYAWTFDGETYFTKEERYGDGDSVELLKKVGDEFVVEPDHFGAYYDGDEMYFDDGDDLMDRAPDSDETIETPIYNYSWEALSSGGAGTDEAEVKKIVKENAADADYGTENITDLVLNAASTNVGDATVDYDLSELLQDENALNDFVALLNDKYLGGTVISSEYPDDHFVKDINEIKVISNGIYVNGLNSSDTPHNINIYTNWKSLYTFSNPVEKTISIRDKIDSMSVEEETEIIDFNNWN